MKKKVILSIVALILIAMVGYTYSIIKGKKYIAGQQGDMLRNSIIFTKAINIENNFTLITLDINSILGEPIFDENGNCELPIFDELKNSPNFKVNDETGIIKVIVEKDNEMIKEFEVKTGDEVSKKILLTSSGEYRITVNGGDFRGRCKLDIESYEII